MTRTSKTRKPSANVRRLDRFVVEYYTMAKSASDEWPTIGAFLAHRSVLAVNAKTVLKPMPNYYAIGSFRAYLRRLARGAR